MARSPLFDIYGEDEFELIPLRRKRRIEDLLPEEEKTSMLRTLANAGSSGLSGLGWLLDTPGSMVRGLLAEGPGKALSALWETSDDRVTGRELLRQYGLAGEEDNWGNFSGGLGTEILLDPLTYLSLGLSALATGGAKTAAAKLATRSGMMGDDLGLLARKYGETIGRPTLGRAEFLRNATPETLLGMMSGPGAREARERFVELAGANADEMLQSPLTRSHRVTMPFISEGARDLYGKAFGDFAAKSSDALGSFSKTAPVIGPAVRTAQALVDPRVMGFTDDADQWMARELTQAAGTGQSRADRILAERLVNVQRDVGAEVFNSPEFANAFRAYMENQQGVTGVVSDAMRELFEGGAAEKLVRFAKGYQARALETARRYGLKLDDAGLPNEIGYFLRQAVEPEVPIAPGGRPVRKPRGYDTAIEPGNIRGGSQWKRKEYARYLPSWLMDRLQRDATLQEALRGAANLDGERSPVREVLDAWLRNADNTSDWKFAADPFGEADRLRKAENSVTDELIASGTAFEDIDPGIVRPMAEARAASETNAIYAALADHLRDAPINYARDNLPLFGNALNDLTRYVRSRERSKATAQSLLPYLGKNVLRQAADNVTGNTAMPIDEALKYLNFDVAPRLNQAGDTVQPALEAFSRQLGLTDPAMLAQMSLPREVVERLGQRITRSRFPMGAEGLAKGVDTFTNLFKKWALLWPARWSRDKYSGSFASAMKGSFNPRDEYIGWQVGRGDYSAIPDRLRNSPGYRQLNSPEAIARGRLRLGLQGTDQEVVDELIIRKFLTDAGGVGLTQANVADDIGRAADNLTYRENFPGAAGPYLSGLFGERQPGSQWRILELGDRLSRQTDAANRIGVYLNRVRRGDAPSAARALSDLTQVNYRPENFTAFERDVVKRYLMPFYSYTKGIAPLVADQIINSPAALMGQSIRAINRGSEPSADQFTPEYLRQSAAIPLSNDIPVIGPLLGLDTPGVTRFLTNIDLPHESLINLFSPGVGNTVMGKAGDALMKTSQNLLGQANPLIKAPLEMALNRQFFTGRQLSDLYSMLEHDFGKIGLGPLGRTAEQIIVNLPFGSRALGTIRQLRDERISMPERLAKLAVNTLTGVKLQDVDQERTARLAARQVLNTLLDQAQGMSTYENLYIKPEDLMNLSEQEKRQYLLYRVLQSQAAREARERKKAAENPLAAFGL